MAYEVLERVALPVLEERVAYVKSDGTEITDTVATGETIIKEPGDTISNKEMTAAGQTDESIASLIESGAIKEK